MQFDLSAVALVGAKVKASKQNGMSCINNTTRDIFDGQRLPAQTG